MVAEKTLIKFGIVKDIDNIVLKSVFKDGATLKEIHIDIYPNNPITTYSAPFMLLLRTIEQNMFVSNNGERLILKKNINKFETHFMNVLFSEITECFYKSFDGWYEFILKIQNTHYKLTIFN